MRMLWPEARDPLDDAGIDDAYAWPPGLWLRANMVSTADGAARSPDGLSAGISSPVDKRVFGRLRGLADAILVGAGTVRAEGYRPARPKRSFEARRAAAGQRPAPVIVVVTRSLDLAPDLPLFAGPVERPVVLTCSGADPGAERRSPTSQTSWSAGTTRSAWPRGWPSSGTGDCLAS